MSVGLLMINIGRFGVRERNREHCYVVAGYRMELLRFQGPRYSSRTSVLLAAGYSSHCSGTEAANETWNVFARTSHTSAAMMAFGERREASLEPAS